jgi:hypothetical protein
MTRQRSYAALDRMLVACRQSESTLTVVLLPVPSAYTDSGYLLQTIVDELLEYFKGHGVKFIDPRDRFQENPYHYFDRTDHLTDAGNEALAELLDEHLKRDAALISE